MNASLRHEALALVNAIFDAIDAKATEWVHQNNSPLPKAKHLRLAREGVIPSSKDGRLVLMKRSDVDAYIANHGRIAAKHIEEGEVESVIRIVERGTRRAG